jgi:UDP:flavonoid glycosyltransferase YjiC (YdhE family)
VGSCLWEPVEPGELGSRFGAGPHDSRPLIYVHHGRAFDHPSFWPTLIETLGQLPVQVVASIGRMDRASGRLPKNVQVRDHVGQQAILPRARLVICGGNSTSVLGALTHGLPGLLLPVDGAEQRDCAEMLSHAGAAICIDADQLTGQAIKEAVDRLLTVPAYAVRARALASEFARWDGPARVTALLEEMARVPLPTRRREAPLVGAP